MSQDTGNTIENRQLRDSSEILSSDVTLEGISLQMTQNFAKIFETLDLLIHGQALIFGNLMMLLNNGQQLPEQTSNTDPDEFQRDIHPQQQHPVALPPSPELSETSENGNLTVNETSPFVRCAECGQTFIRNKSNESITHHANTTTCRPFQCCVCKKLFKTVSLK